MPDEPEAFSLTDAQQQAVDEFWQREASQLAEAATDALPWSGGIDRC
jgi:hypothetical protein